MIIGSATISLMLFGAMGLWHSFLLLGVTGIVSWLTGQVVVARYQDIKRKKEKKIAEYVLHNPKIYGSIIGGWR